MQWRACFGMSSAGVNEHEPLLPSPGRSERSSKAKSRRTCWPNALALSTAKDAHSHTQSKIIICIFLLQFLINFSKYVVEVPLIRLFEMAICDRYFHSRSTDEKLCKTPRIQDDLAIIIGWRFFFDALPALVTAIFYGRLADRYGRRIVLFLSCLGLLCNLLWIVCVCYYNRSLPIQLVWASSAFVFVVSPFKLISSLPF